jgi:tetratricopeptide (TPR) repeat protein
MTRWRVLWALLSAALLTACAVSPAERNNAGNALYAQGDYSMALRAYQAAMVADPDGAEPYYNAASALARSGRQQAAVEALLQALRTADGPVAQAVYYNLGNVYFEMARYEDAAAAYRTALLLNPQDDDARFNYELALLRLAAISPTPPPSEAASPTPTTAPDQGGAATPTPTQPGGSAGGAQTATAQPVTPTPVPPSDAAASEAPDAPDGGLSREEAARSLDAVQQSQRTLREVLQGRTTPQAPPAKDW